MASSVSDVGLSGKVCIITGASSGLGQATAIMFARRGAMVTLCGRDQERLKDVLDQCIQASGGQDDRFITVQGDVCDAAVREDIVAKTIQKFGRLDVLVANAGIVQSASTFHDTTETEYNNVFDTNVKSAFFLIQKATPHLVKSKGNVVTVSSISSTLASVPVLLYNMSKAAVDNMTRCLALELGIRGVRVNAVNPSFIHTRIRRGTPGDLDQITQAVVDKEKLKQPMGECGTPDDIAEAICFLASDAAKFITGECLIVDGGRRFTGPRDEWTTSAKVWL